MRLYIFILLLTDNRQPETVNPHAIGMENNPQYYINGVLEQNRRLLSKTITLLESTLPAHRNLASKVLTQLLPHSGKALRLGITGVPGSGKSTFIETLGLRLADTGHKVAVLAVDPSSRRSGGSILGDKTRMEKLATHENTFIRPSPAGLTLGGVAAKTREIMLVCEAAGFDVILVETVGVGQSETSVAGMVDFFLVMLLAGAGDELQGIKKGILEVADAIVINKADGENKTSAEKACQDLSSAIRMVVPKYPSWRTPVLTSSSQDNESVNKVWQTVLDHTEKMKASGAFVQLRKQQGLEWMWAAIDEGLKRRFDDNKKIREILPQIIRQVENESLSPISAAESLLSYLDRD